MKKQSFIRNIVLGALTLALVVGGLAVGERRAKADVTFTIVGPTSLTVDGPIGSYTIATHATGGEAITITGYSWGVTGDCLSGTGGGDTFQPAIENADNAGNTSTVTCRVTYTEGSTTGLNLDVTPLAVTVAQATRTLTISGNATMTADSSQTLSATATPSGKGGAVTFVTEGTPSTGISCEQDTGVVTAAAGAHGSITVHAHIAAVRNYSSADSSPLTITVNLNLIDRTSVTITSPSTGAPLEIISLTAVADPAVYGDNFTWESQNADAGIVFSESAKSVSSFAGANGTIQVRATVAANGGYNAKTSDWQTITIAPVAPVLTMTDNVSMNLYDAAGSKSITATSTNTDAANKPTYHVTAATANVIDINATTGAITPKAAGVATVYATQAASDRFGAIDEAAATAAGYTRTVTVTAPALSFNKTSVSLKKGETASVTLTAAGIPTGGAIAITSGNTAVATVSPASATGSGTTNVTITAVKDGTATVKASYTQGATEYKGETAVTVTLPATYFSMYSWYDYLNKSYPKTEVTAIQVNPGNTMGVQADTYWYVENPSILKLVWSTPACYNDGGVYKSRCEVKGLRNGTTRVVVRTGDARVGYTYGYYTITVMGNPRIPQTGPDDTPILIVEALLALTLFSAAGVALYMRRREPQGRP